MMKDVKKFIFNLYNNNGSFSYSPANRISNLYSTCFGVMCLDLINELDHFQDTDKVANYILSYQDGETGYFIDKTAVPEDDATHNNEYIYLQLTDFAQLALSALNKEDQHEYFFLNKYKDVKYLESWFYGLNWTNPWLVSNLVMFVLNCLIYEDETKNKIYSDHIIYLLNKTQNPKNGYWNLGNKVTLHNQMAGAYHFIFFYTYLDIEPNYIEKIIDSTLAIQNYDGLFNYEGGGGSCDDLDAIDLLCRATLYSDHNISQVKKSLQVAYQSLLSNQNKNGGFCWAKRNNLSLNDFIYLINFKMLRNKHDLIFNGISKTKKILRNITRNETYWKYSGLENMKLKTSDSDLFSTWFRLTSIAFIETTFPDIRDRSKYQSFNWNLRKKCGLGFYKQ
ncbi:prenyltransferase/squalene oxidase repeat-containing protein [Methanosarcina sp. Mfa9]|uniref:prenyltransferase/squalene oxidase repeat-containing protein n=1 Tax=Methanosarcina sp. Mfa9 TaxID=3439063 RepID=UPI003F85F9FC